MTEAELTRIGTELGITVPCEYREFMLAKAAELKGFTHRIAGTTCPWFLDTLYLNPGEVIQFNLIERQPDAGSGYAFPDWWQMLFLIGSNGTGDYFCLRLDGAPTVWVIGSDCGSEAPLLWPSLAEMVEAQIGEYWEEAAE